MGGSIILSEIKFEFFNTFFRTFQGKSDMGLKSLVCFRVLMLILPFLATGALEAKDFDLGIIYTSNTNGYIFSCDCSDENLGGMARRASVFKTLRKYNDRKLLFLDAGNVHSSYPRNIQDDKLVEKIYNILKYDVRNIGEQDLVYGKTFFEKYVRSAQSVSLNLREASGKERLKPYILKKKSGFRIAILGLLTKNAYSVVPDSIQRDFELADELQSLKSTLKSIQKLKPDMVILLLRALDYNLEFKLARELKTIDLILTCSERFALKPVWQESVTLIASAGKDGEQVGRLFLKYSDGAKKWSVVSAGHIRLNEEINPDSKVVKIIQNKKLQ